ncbi:CPBP family intramembrane glutamic endopeptidase [Clostridium thermobutyricum]|uniref:CPBP family intramembrane glutamic endopeptidase n=1 Tax=Clostridium thermobutyricum TaxID=29372 RepID=UPI0018AAC4B4|nr:type II CAAX endopeptidase family protein [Clostridium thermobutyricum]
MKVKYFFRAFILMLITVIMLIASIIFRNLIIDALGLNDSVAAILGPILYGLVYLIIFYKIKINFSEMFRKNIKIKYVILLFILAFLYIIFESLMLILMSNLPKFDLYNITNVIKFKGFTQISNIIYTFLITIIIAPFCEEVLYRGVILDNMIKLQINKPIAIFLSAIIFSISHMNLAQGINALVYGIFAGILYCKGNDIKYNILFHSSINFITFLMISLR